MIVIVTGGRDYADAARVGAELRAVYLQRAKYKGEAMNVWHGACRGADALAAAWAKKSRCTPVPFPAAWREDGLYNPNAGPERNERMVSLAAGHKRNGHTVVVIAFPGGKGTANCVRHAKAYGLDVHMVIE